MKILAVIPARGGSKGILHKNIRAFNGKPLLAFAVDQAKSSRHINRVIVSTDDQVIADVALRHGAEVPFLRPKELAGDQSQVADTLVHLLNSLKISEGYEPDYLVMLQTTSPLRTVADIDGSLDKLFETNADAVVSLCETEQLLYTMDNKRRLCLVSDKKFLKSTNRQALEQTYMLNGAMVYGIKTDIFLRDKSFFKCNLVGFVVDQWRSVDLDEPADFLVAELLHKNINYIHDGIKNFK